MDVDKINSLTSNKDVASTVYFQEQNQKKISPIFTEMLNRICGLLKDEKKSLAIWWHCCGYIAG